LCNGGAYISVNDCHDGLPCVAVTALWLIVKALW